MAQDSFNLWKLTAIVMGLLGGTSLVTGLVVANWRGPEPAAKPAVTSPAPSRPSAPAARASAVPTQEVIDACNREATARTGERNRTTEVVKDGAILNENRKHDERYREAYASCMRARGYAGDA